MRKKLLCLVLAVIMSIGVFASCTNKNTTLSSITIVDGSFNTQYRVGDVLDLSNAKIEVKLSDDTVTQVAITADMVTGFDTSTTEPSKKLTVTYKSGDITKTADFTYSVIAAKTLEEKYVDMLKLNMEGTEYRIDAYMPGVDFAIIQMNVKRSSNGDLLYCNGAELESSGNFVTEVMYSGNICYNYNTGEYYRISPAKLATEDYMMDILYLLKTSVFSELTSSVSGFSVTYPQIGKVVIKLDNDGRIIEISIEEEIILKFSKEFVETKPTTEGLTFLQDYDINVFCGCDNHDGGKFVDNIISIERYTISDCKKAGKEIEYIFTDEDKTILLDVFTKLDSDLNLYVTWRNETATITWCNDNQGVWERTQVTIGELAEPYMVRERNDFDNYVKAWYTDKELTNKFDFSLPITEDLSLYPELIPDDRAIFNVIFNYSQTNAPSGYIEVKPTRKGDYIMPFDESSLVKGMMSQGWYTDSARTKVFNPKTPITGNVELYIKLVPDTRTYHTVTVMCGLTGHTHEFEIVRFETLNGSEFSSECEKSNVSRYEFFINEHFTGRQYYNSMPISHNCTLYVKWSAR